jgi:hypothetical protein
MDQRRCTRPKPFATSSEEHSVCRRKDSAAGITDWRETRDDGTACLDSGANRLVGFEEGSTRERPGRPDSDHRVNSVARHTRSSCDLFDSEDVRENGHRRSADEGKSLASPPHADLGLI